jgi:hypothetical protein
MGASEMAADREAFEKWWCDYGRHFVSGRRSNARVVFEAGYAAALDASHVLSSQPAPKEPETAWLLEGELDERTSQQTYICVDGGILAWTTDPNKALRLSRRADADALAELCDNCWRVTEHMWPDVGSVASQPEAKDVQYWLAELDQYGNPKLIDGAHSDAQGANRAAYLITAMRLGAPNRKFAVARVELSECTPSAAGVNLEAVRTINNARDGASQPKEQEK